MMRRRRKEKRADSHQLRQAAALGDVATMRSALRMGQAVNEADADGWFALALAACCGKGMGMPVELLLQAGADMDRRLPNGATPVYLAAQNGHKAAVQKLVAAGADLSIGCGGHTPADIAKKRGFVKVAELLYRAAARPNPAAVERMAVREAEAGERLALQRAVIVVQGAWRAKLARREAARLAALANQEHVLPPDLDMEGFAFTCAAFKDLFTRSIPLFLTAAVLVWDKFTDWVILIAWLLDTELRAGPLWWAPLASFVILLLAGAGAAIVGLDEPHNLGTVGFGDKDPRFMSGKLRRLLVVTLGGVGLLPLTYAMGYARLGPATAMAASAPGGLSTVVSAEGEPTYFRSLQLAYVLLEAAPQAMLQMYVGVMDAKLDPFDAADGGLDGMPDGIIDGGARTAIEAAAAAGGGAALGVGGGDRFSFVLFVSLASSFVAAGVAFSTLDPPDGAVPFHRHKLYVIHRECSNATTTPPRHLATQSSDDRCCRQGRSPRSGGRRNS